MTKTYDERLKDQDDKIARLESKLKAEKTKRNAIKSKKTAQERKRRTSALVQMGLMLSEMYKIKDFQDTDYLTKEQRQTFMHQWKQNGSVDMKGIASLLNRYK